MFVKSSVLVLIFILLVGCVTQEKIEGKNEEVLKMKLTSSEFENNALIPSKYTCDGEQDSPRLKIEDVPEGTKSLVLIMDDPDIPQEVKQARGINVFDHWVLFNIDPNTKEIDTNQVPGVQGSNSAGENKYIGPCPPKQYQPTMHRYFFKLYALDIQLDLQEGSTKTEVEKAMEGHILEQTELIGKYERK